MLSVIKGDDETDIASMRLASVVHFVITKRIKESAFYHSLERSKISTSKEGSQVERINIVDINIANQMRNAFFDMVAYNLFISEKAMGKLGLSVSKLTKKINIINFKEVTTVGVM
ncbi:hypothetical protein J1N35_037985 [Gossypium stocksii]|uniref:Uncharacterized protein n=1 Tax=Gossypium stocksii TaxID=47602 RepID=A0A9D3UL52_9ROSI|nr:hypothetical protein J1N35_037985 [Gossypium stocksii]